MPAQANIKAVITAEDKASAVLKGFGTNVDNTSKSITGGLNASVLAVGAATAGIVAFGKKSFDAFNQQDLAIHRLQAGINNVKSATDKHIGSLIAQAVALQKTTRFSDEAYISAQGILTTFQLNQKAIEKLTPRLADMSEGLARVTGEMPDLEGNAILIAKAIGGEDTAGLTGALRRVGVIMTKTQTELLKTGTVEQRVALVTQILDQNFKGLATSAGDTTAGKVAQLKNQFNDLQEKVGKLIAEALTPLLNILNAHPVVLTTVTIAIGTLATAFVGLKIAAAIGPVFSLAATAITGVGTAAVTTTGFITSMSAFISGPGLLAIGPFALALGTIAAAYIAIQNAANGARKATDDAYNASVKAGDAQDQAIKKIQQSTILTPTQKANQIRTLFGGGRAAGGPVQAGIPYIVGEKGPELIVPQNNGTVIPNDKLSGPNINVTFQGVFTGSQMEFRKLAVQVFKAYEDAKGMGTV